MGGKSSGQTRGRQFQESEAGGISFVDPSQQPYLDWLRQQGQGVAAGQLPAGQAVGAGAAQDAQALRGYAGQLAGGYQANPYTAQLGGFQGGVTAPNNEALEAQIGALGSDIDAQLRRQIGGSGGLNTDAALAGNLGGGRNQVAQGIAAGDAARAFAGQAAGLRGDFAQQQNQMQMQAQLANQAAELQGLGQAGQLSGMDEQLRQQALAGGAGVLPGATNLGRAGMGAAFAPLAAYAGLVGAPTVLDTRFQRSTSEGITRGNDSAWNINW